MTDVSDAIESSAQGPKSASVDGQSATAHSLPEQIAADEYLREVAIPTRAVLPIRTAKFKPDGTL